MFRSVGVVCALCCRLLCCESGVIDMSENQHLNLIKTSRLYIRRVLMVLADMFMLSASAGCCHSKPVMALRRDDPAIYMRCDSTVRIQPTTFHKLSATTIQYTSISSILAWMNHLLWFRLMCGKTDWSSGYHTRTKVQYYSFIK
jgi:hypothetical protein